VTVVLAVEAAHYLRVGINCGYGRGVDDVEEAIGKLSCDYREHGSR
jgi:hypothetical protein